MIEIEAAQVLLIGFPFAAMLTDDESGDGFQQFPGAHQRPILQFGSTDVALRGGIGDAELRIAAADNHHLRQLRSRVLAGKRAAHPPTASIASR